jgi:hypothetical protein
MLQHDLLESAMASRISHEQFIERLTKENPTIKVLGTFTGISNPILVSCPQGHEWSPIANSILRALKRSKTSNGCPTCSGKKRKTQDEFILELKKISPAIKVLGQFISVDKKVEVTCLSCKHQWSTTGNSLLRGSGCMQCGIESMKAKQRKPPSQFIEDARRVNPKIEVLGSYINSTTLISCKCKSCNYSWNVLPTNLLAGKGCPKCAGMLSMSNEEFISKLKEIQPNIKVNGVYHSNKSKAPCECQICGWQWTPPLHRLLKDRGCPQCAGVPDITPEFFHAAILKKRMDLTVLGKYTKMRSSILCCCNSCNYQWETPAQHIWKNSSGCPICSLKKAGEEQRKTHDQFMVDFQKANKDFHKIKIFSTYELATTKMDAQCLTCNHIWHPLPTTLTRGSGCPICNSAGYDQSKPGIFYLYEIEFSQSTYWGFGISNQYEFREKTHLKNLRSNAANLANKYLFYFEDGKECLEIEKYLKKHLKKIGLAHNLGIEGFITECATIQARDHILFVIDGSNAIAIGSEEEINNLH